MIIPVEVTSQKIADQMVAALEGGSNYWLRSVKFQYSERKTNARPWYSDSKVFDGGFIFTVYFDAPGREEGNGKATRVIGVAEVARGLKAMAETHPMHFGDLMADRGDAETADVFMQFVTFGEVIYG